MVQDNQKFFLVVTPRFERLALYELISYLKKRGLEAGTPELFVGGIEVELPMEIGLALNHSLKIPTRILLRWARKEILGFKEFEQWLKTMDWKQFGPLGLVYVSSRSSKLKIKDAVKESFLKVVKTEGEGTDVYLRFFRDECTISLDTSGEDLFRRGYDKWIGQAPIRDTMAAGLLQMALQGVDDFSEWEVVDPMMGSATFLLEARLLNKNVERPFSYQNWKNIGKVETPDFSQVPPTVKGFDLNAKNVEIAAHNLKILGVEDAELNRRDVTRGKRLPHAKGKRLVITNFPYGKRISIKDKNFFTDALKKLGTDFSADRLAILLPRGLDPLIKGYEQVRAMPFSNNGIDVGFFVFVREPVND